jgi:hypothetical protein
MSHNRPSFNRKKTECVYKDRALYNGRGRQRRIAEGRLGQRAFGIGPFLGTEVGAG